MLAKDKYYFEHCVQAETLKSVDLMSSDDCTSMWSNVMSLYGPWRMFVALRIKHNLTQTLLSAMRPEQSSSTYYLQITEHAIT
jgi:hypothetical protein